MTKQEIAKGCYEANRIYCKSIGDDSLPAWDDAAPWQKMSVINGVEFHQANPDATPSDSHENWVKDRLADGWKWGEKKNVETKEHPCLQSFDKLSVEQQRKDMIFLAVAKELSTENDVASASEKVLTAIIKDVLSEKIEEMKAPKEKSKKSIVEKIVEKVAPKKTLKKK